MSVFRRLGRLGLASLGAAAVGVLALAAPAAAHVTVDPKQATQGGYARVAFRVPTESDTASTTKLEVFLPDNAPVPNVSTMPVAGWTAQVTKKKLDKPLTDDDGKQITEVASQITWTANSADAAIRPGQFLEFPVSLGPLPKADKLTFKVLQTYSDGNVARWIEEASGGKEPDHPAPVLTLAAAAGGDTHGAAPAGNSGSSGDTHDEAATTGHTAAWPGITGLIAGVLALLLAVVALVRTRRPETPATTPTPAAQVTPAESTK